MVITALVNGFLTYLLLMIIIAGVAFLSGFAALKLRKRNDAKKKTNEK